MNLSFWEIAKIIKAKNNFYKWNNFNITGIEFNSNLIKYNNLFIPLSCGKKDGHLFIIDAFLKKASCSLCEIKKIKNIKNIKFPILLVKNSLYSMQILSKYFLNKINPFVIAITGSNGKTTTKNLISFILSNKFNIYKTIGNFNNDIGVPYTILHMPLNTEKIILELGMNKFNDIKFLSLLISPDIAIITNIGDAHIGELGSRENIIKAKLEIIYGFKKNSWLLINYNDYFLIKKILKKNKNNKIKIKTFSINNNSKATYFCKILKVLNNKVFLRIFNFKIILIINTFFIFNIISFFIAIILGYYFNIKLNKIFKILYNLKYKNNNRLEILKSKKGFYILNDSYNSNPLSLKMVLNEFKIIKKFGKNKIVVLGDMLDLGKFSINFHKNIYKYLDPYIIKKVFLYGKYMKYLYFLLKKKYNNNNLFYFNNIEKLFLKLIKYLSNKTFIMFKASRNIKLDKIVLKLLKI